MMRVLLGLVALLVCVGVAAAVWSLSDRASGALGILVGGFDQPASADARREVITVHPGASAGDIGTELERRGLIRSALEFRMVIESRGLAGQLKAGDYEVSPSMRPSEIAQMLASGAVRPSPRLTVPEGWRATQIAQRLDELGVIRGDEFLALVASPGPVRGEIVPAEAESLEGYLFPETYELDARMTSAQLVARMLEQFNLQFDPELRRRAQGQGLSLHQAVTLASIVEREAVLPAERPIIAGVFLNRLKADMPLQADPTVQYAVANRDLTRALTEGFWKPALNEEDLEIDSPYNTYRSKGLPPGPICNPGLDALKAVAEPASVPYQYFVARADGSHAFAVTLEEHERNVAEVRR